MKRTGNPIQPVGGAGVASGATALASSGSSVPSTLPSGANTKQASPRGRRPSAETKPAMMGVGNTAVPSSTLGANGGTLQSSVEALNVRLSGGRSAFGPPSKQSDIPAMNEEPQKPTQRDIDFLGPGLEPEEYAPSTTTLPTSATATTMINRSSHARRSSDELDYSAVFNAMHQRTSPNPVAMGSSTQVRPVRLNTIRNFPSYTAPQQLIPQPLVQLASSHSEPSTPNLLPDGSAATTSTSRPSSPAGARPASPSQPRPQPTSPLTVRSASPLPGVPRPSSPPQNLTAVLSASARPRSASQDGKVTTTGVRTMSSQQQQQPQQAVNNTQAPSASARLGITPSHVVPPSASVSIGPMVKRPSPIPSQAQPVVAVGGVGSLSGATGARTIVQAQRSGPGGGAVSAPTVGGGGGGRAHQPNWSGTASTGPATRLGNVHQPSATTFVPHHQQQPHLVQQQQPPQLQQQHVQTSSSSSSAVGPAPPGSSMQLDFNNLSIEQLELLQLAVSSEIDQRKRGAPIGYPMSGSAPVPLKGHKPKQDSLDEINLIAAGPDDGPGSQNVNRQRTSSQDAGRLAPNQKMFESSQQVPGEDSRSSSAVVDRKTSSPKLKFGHAPPQRDGIFQATPSHPPVPLFPAITVSDDQSASMACAVPDLSRSVDILSPGSAFKPGGTGQPEDQDGELSMEAGDGGMGHPHQLLFENKEEDPAME